MRLQAVLPKTLLLIMCFITLQNEAFGLGGIGLGLDLAELHQHLFGNTKSESEDNLASLVTLYKIPYGRNEDNKTFSNVTIKGIVSSDADRFNIDLVDTSFNIDLHISLRFPNKTIFNTYEKEGVRINYGYEWPVEEKTGGWDEEEVYEELAIEPENDFEIIISITDEESFKIDISGKLYWFKFRTPLENLIFLRILGDVAITSVTWNGLTN